MMKRNDFTDLAAATDDGAESDDAGTRQDLPLAIATIAISPESPVPIYEQICSIVRSAIVAGDLPANTLLPTSRELAAMLGIGRTTAVNAYSRLIAEGYLVSRLRRGTRVAPQQRAAVPAAGEGAQARPAAGSNPLPDIEISFTARRTLECVLSPGANVQPFAVEEPDPTLCPRAELGRLLAEGFRRPPIPDSGLDQGRELHVFQSAVAAYIRQARGVVCDPSQIVPTLCIESALDLISRLLIDPGHLVHIEDPGPALVKATFDGAGARIRAVSGDRDGADFTHASAPPPRLIVVSPALSFPLGAQMSEARRRAVMDVVQSTGAILFENDAYGQLLYRGGRLPALQAHEPGRVIYYGSLCNTLGPGIRVGYLVVPERFIEPAFELSRRSGSRPDSFVLSALASFIGDGQYALYTRKIRAIYAQRLKVLVEACRTHIRDAALVEPCGGFHLTLLTSASREQSICGLAAAQGLAVAPLSRFYAGRQSSYGFVLGFGAVPDRLIEQLVVRLATIIQRADESAVLKAV
jgi:GntR family transcriptional regulator/MocR family aminotransferase